MGNSKLVNFPMKSVIVRIFITKLGKVWTSLSVTVIMWWLLKGNTKPEGFGGKKPTYPVEYVKSMLLACQVTEVIQQV